MNDTKLEKLFKGEYKILKCFLEDPDREINLAMALKHVNMSKMTIYRILEKMEKMGLLKSRTDNYRRFYKLIDSPLIPVLKTLINLDSPIITEMLRDLKSKSHLIILYGSRANGTNRSASDWDFLVVSDELDSVILNQKVTKLEMKYDCQINVKHYTISELNKIKSEKTPFYSEVMSNKYILKGTLDET